MTQTVDPKAIDRQLAEINTRRWEIVDAISSTYTRVHYAIGDRKIGRHQSWAMTNEEALDRLTARLEDKTDLRIQSYASALTKLTELEAQLADATAEFDRVEAPFHETPWSRFFLVDGGHIHSSRFCGSLRPTTRVGWLPDLSGDTEEKAVAEHGPLLCTRCFPTAPVAWTVGLTKPEDPTMCANKRRGEWVSQGVSRYAKCPECGAVASVTSIGNLRKHKRPTE